MSMLESGDYSSILDILAALREPRSREDLARIVIPQLAKLLGSDITSYNEVNPAAREVTGFIEPDEFDIASLSATLERFMHDHPVIMHNHRTGGPEALRISDFISQRELHDTGLYRELYRPMGVEYQISITLPTRKPLIAALVFNRKTNDFSDRDRAVLNILRPHLATAFDSARFTSRLRKSLARYHGALEDMPEGIVVLNGLSRVELGTHKARYWMGKYFPGAARAPGALPEELAAWLRRQAPPGYDPGASSPLFVKKLLSDQLSVRLIRTEEKRRMLLFSETRALTSAKPLEGLGLTPRQAEVLLHLAQGCANEQIARQLHLSVRTVHKHLETIFKTLKVSSRTAACRIVHDRLHVVILTLILLSLGLMDSLNVFC